MLWLHAPLFVWWLLSPLDEGRRLHFENSPAVAVGFASGCDSMDDDCSYSLWHPMTLPYNTVNEEPISQPPLLVTFHTQVKQRRNTHQKHLSVWASYLPYFSSSVTSSPFNLNVVHAISHPTDGLSVLAPDVQNISTAWRGRRLLSILVKVGRYSIKLSVSNIMPVVLQLIFHTIFHNATIFLSLFIFV